MGLREFNRFSGTRQFILGYKIFSEIFFSGDDCVSTEYVEDERVGKIYGNTLINAVRDVIHKSQCLSKDIN